MTKDNISLSIVLRTVLLQGECWNYHTVCVGACEYICVVWSFCCILQIQIQKEICLCTHWDQSESFTSPPKYWRFHFCEARLKITFLILWLDSFPLSDLDEASVGGLSMRTQCAPSACSVIERGSFNCSFNSCSTKPTNVSTLQLELI